jgi:hypothetical protein
MTPEVGQAVEHIDDALRPQPTPEYIVVMRETGFEAFDRSISDLEGTVQRDPAYLSTALGSDPNFNPGNHVQVPAGTPAMYLEGLSHYPERELLLGRGLPYTVERVVHDGRRFHVFGRIAPT